MNLLFKKITHIGIIVKDINKTVANYADKYGIGPWSLYVCGPENVIDMKVGGKKSEYHFIAALCYIKDMGIKLIQPLDEKSIYHRFLEKYGENLHHIGYKVDGFEKSVEIFKDKGIEVSMSGNFYGKNKYAYFDSLSEVKHIVDIAESEPGFFETETSEYGISWSLSPAPSKIYPFAENIKNMTKPVFKRLGQVAFIVKSVDDTVKRLADEYGIGPWRIWEFGPETVYDMTVWGKRQDYRMRLALAKIGDIDFELIQPHDKDSIYYEYMQKFGEGFHHLAYEVENFEEVMKYMDKLSIEISMSGVWEGKHTWVYLTTGKDLKHIVELNYTEPGYIYPDPVAHYPER